MTRVLPFPEFDPALFTVTAFGMELSLRWYALAYLAGLVIGCWLMIRLMKRPALWPANRAPMTTAQPEEILTWMVLGVVLGGRLGFVLFYNPAYYLAHPMEALQIWQGGMSFHGGFLGVILGVVLYCRSRGLPVIQVGDAVALATPPGLFFGRIANFINGELWGRPTEVPWAMVFPAADAFPRHPSQIYEALLEGLVLFLVMWWLALRRGQLKRPGTMIGVFALGYGLARCIVENFRQGNAEFVTATNPNGQFWRFGDTADAWGLTMGQILSLPMIAAGIAIILWAQRRAARTAAADAGGTGGTGGA
ncbi:prolipoprotein diacylglyceryl transferase [Paralimibaculum aggregatum]|uniref:Phosphatidylglycerol--prolipoprotein diacylglyceryl transferase n=1 Tax=Paralimibaculum aggregatum TaxID=3036245 RepID=A0ABQ6LKA7_9RHOB|nr:prolipoprotein diacylglyceryl transferase [Limibaculum sp. NKW23]GMG83688.1 prolipoprotein diacylglyceryl transferase [Limibaculum sp. NKW23]